MSTLHCFLFHCQDLLDEQNKYHQLHEKLQMLEKRIADGERALSDQRQQHVEELATTTTKLQKQLSSMCRQNVKF